MSINVVKAYKSCVYAIHAYTVHTNSQYAEEIRHEIEKHEKIKIGNTVKIRHNGNVIVCRITLGLLICNRIMFTKPPHSDLASSHLSPHSLVTFERSRRVLHIYVHKKTPQNPRLSICMRISSQFESKPIFVTNDLNTFGKLTMDRLYIPRFTNITLPSVFHPSIVVSCVLPLHLSPPAQFRRSAICAECGEGGGAV